MLPTSSAALPALSVILVLFPPAGLLLETAYRTNSQLEADFCRFQVCDPPRLIETARSRRLLLSPEAAALGLRESVEALRRDPAAAAPWRDAGEALLPSGNPHPAPRRPRPAPPRGRSRQSTPPLRHPRSPRPRPSGVC